MKPLKISLLLDLQGLMAVIESLPEGHSLMPYLVQKRDALMSAHRIHVKTLSTRKES